MTALRSISGGVIWVLLAPLLYAGMSISAKLAGNYLSVWQVGVGRFVFGLLLVPIIVRALSLNLWGQQRFLLALRGLCGSVAFLLLVASFQRIPLSLAMVLFYLYPAFTTLLSPWITGEPPAKLSWLLIGSAFIGTSLILWPHEASAALNPGHLFAVIASVLCALTLLLVRRLGKDNNIYTLFFYLCITGTLAGLGPMLMQGTSILPQSSAAWASVAAVAVFFNSRPADHQPGADPHTRRNGQHYDDSRSSFDRRLWRNLPGRAAQLAFDSGCRDDLRQRCRSQSAARKTELAAIKADPQTPKQYQLL